MAGWQFWKRERDKIEESSSSRHERPTMHSLEAVPVSELGGEASLEEVTSALGVLEGRSGRVATSKVEQPVESLELHSNRRAPSNDRPTIPHMAAVGFGVPSGEISDEGDGEVCAEGAPVDEDGARLDADEASDEASDERASDDERGALSASNFPFTGDIDPDLIGMTNEPSRSWSSRAIPAVVIDDPIPASRFASGIFARALTEPDDAPGQEDAADAFVGEESSPLIGGEVSGKSSLIDVEEITVGLTFEQEFSTLTGQRPLASFEPSGVFEAPVSVGLEKAPSGFEESIDTRPGLAGVSRGAFLKGEALDEGALNEDSGDLGILIEVDVDAFADEDGEDEADLGAAGYATASFFSAPHPLESDLLDPIPPAESNEDLEDILFQERAASEAPDLSFLADDPLADVVPSWSRPQPPPDRPISGSLMPLPPAPSAMWGVLPQEDPRRNLSATPRAPLNAVAASDGAPNEPSPPSGGILQTMPPGPGLLSQPIPEVVELSAVLSRPNRRRRGRARRALSYARQVPTNLQNRVEQEPGPSTGNCKRLIQRGAWVQAHAMARRLLDVGPVTGERRELYRQTHDALLPRALDLLGPRSRIPRLRRSLSRLQNEGDIDPHQAYLLSQIDGRTSLEALLDLAVAPRDEAALQLLIMAQRQLLSW